MPDSGENDPAAAVAAARTQERARVIATLEEALAAASVEQMTEQDHGDLTARTVRLVKAEGLRAAIAIVASMGTETPARPTYRAGGRCRDCGTEFDVPSSKVGLEEARTWLRAHEGHDVRSRIDWDHPQS